jgi:hypothetical protein
MSGYWEVPNDYAYPVDIGHGSAHSVSSEQPPRDRVEELRRVVEEVTRKEIKREIRRIGF